MAWDYSATERGGYPGYDDAAKNMPFWIGVAFEEWRCLRRPRAGGARVSALLHALESVVPLGLPRGTPVFPRIGHAPVCKPGFHRDKPGGEQFEVACEGGAETGFHRDKPHSSSRLEKPGAPHKSPEKVQSYPAVVQKPASTGTSPDGELPWQLCSDRPEPPFLNLTAH